MNSSRHEINRVRRNTAPHINQRIDEQTARNVRIYSAQPPHVIDRRIRELEQTWSIERVLQANASMMGFITSVLALTTSKKWGLLTLGALGFSLLHGVQGWDPPLPLLRRLGLRTRSEIDEEIYALKALRGEFRDMKAQPEPDIGERAEKAIEAIRR